MRKACKMKRNSKKKTIKMRKTTMKNPKPKPLMRMMNPSNWKKYNNIMKKTRMTKM